ncbi:MULTISPECIES: thiamine pyrophosphate-binding protein [Clostridium]|uniref:thiamine pyrophosphate-binding protein n=1 Tax=Clostridium TaxID=1485 RepID=UPI0015E19562|nr:MULTISPECIES: thiamine pyrophosphate-binding protein [Clostridium]MBN7573060.1 thiamine pyrophosphate-binding protein [Clostridium beijerinckii]MBN7578399.1 thiamine pyrophosphate-binding protein [Clostridium beijerinckii]MBN7582834.1 thiamine pyrophosphate-binding protein [Clostridium beijerinckii]MBO0518999.1 thiamine pyrophosphate-binding protein [Clostridium beijerinckii]
MKISDYVMEFISELSIKHVFYISGGGAMHLNDSLGRNENLNGICMLHEQGASIAAEAYARINEGYGVCLVTSGPGGTNAITGLAGAYYDSTPVIFISGQAKRADLVNDQNIRQFGIQETDIVSIAKPISKYAVQIQEPEEIRYELEKAAAIAVNGKPGPVWIDIPLDIQAMQVDVESLKGYNTSELRECPCNKEDIDKTIELFNKAKRPALILGNGIRLAGGVEEARELYELLNAPVMTSWNGVDLIEDSHPLFYGRPGAVGHRHSNFIQQNADFVLTIGTRLNLLSTGYNFESFLEKADHVMVEIDENEMKKKSVHPKLAINCDAKAFIKALLERKEELKTNIRTEWIEHCNILRDKYPRFIPEQEPRDGFVSTYRLVDEISNKMTENDIYQFTSSGTSVDIAMKVFRIKKGQRAFLTKGLAAMGYDLPASIGSCIASGGKRTVCVTGDGSIVMNIQELEILKRLKLPVKLFVVDNNGYSMIYGSQDGNFNGHLTGCTPESGLTLPDMKKLAEAFGIKAYHIENVDELSNKVSEILEYDGPVVCTVKADITQKILPKQTNYMREDGQMASRPLEDMSPLLDRDEFEDNFIQI